MIEILKKRLVFPLRILFRYSPPPLKKILPPFLLGKSYRIVKCSSLDEVLKAGEIRYRVYLEAGYILPEDFPNQRIVDDYDEVSDILLIYHNSTPIGTVRFINYSDKGFPIFKLFNIVDFPSKVDLHKTQEVSKLAILSQYRGHFLPLSLWLIVSGWYLARQKGINWWLFWTTNYLFENFMKGWFNVSYERLKFLPPAPEHLKERDKTARFYFQNYQLYPFLVHRFRSW